MKQIALKSGADIEPAATQHVTLWGSKEARQAYLPDIKKLEKFFHTKCAEPLRCGLDRRSTHFVLLKDHAEYQAWCRVEFDLLGSESAGKDDPPGVKEQRRKAVLDGFSCPSRSFWAISLQPFPSIHRPVAGGLANMYFWQLARPPHSKVRPLQTGFINAVESALYGSPISTFGAVAYGAATRYSGPGNSGWSVLVRQRMATKQATPLGELLKMDTDAMSQPHYAEGWTLVGLLSKQPAKFGKLLLELRKGGSDLEAIEKVYGWDEEKLTEQWRRYVMGQGGKGCAETALRRSEKVPGTVFNGQAFKTTVPGTFFPRVSPLSICFLTRRANRHFGNTPTLPPELEGGSAMGIGVHVLAGFHVASHLPVAVPTYKPELAIPTRQSFAENV